MDLSILIGVVPAIITCFFGYKMHRILIFLSWFLFGAVLSYWLLVMHFVPPISFLISLFIGGFVGFLGIKLYRAGIFILCFFIVFLICFINIPNDILRYVFGFITGITAGICGVKFSKIAIMFITAFGGGFAIVEIFVAANLFYEGFFALIIGLIISMIGYSIQKNWIKTKRTEEM